MILFQAQEEQKEENNQNVENNQNEENKQKEEGIQNEESIKLLFLIPNINIFLIIILPFTFF